MDALVSVIIPTFNSGKTIGGCLASIAAQSHSNVETIIVDNFSEDSTVDIAKKHDVTLLSHHGERTSAKNLGLSRANGEFVCFIDSDMELGGDVLMSCVRMMGDGVGGIIIPERSVGGSFWTRVRDFERSFYAGTEVESARFFRRDLAIRAGMFEDGVILFEEKSLPERIRGMGYDVEARVGAHIDHMEHGFSLPQWLEKRFYYGKTLRRAKHTSLLYRAGLFLKDRRFFANPVLALGVLALKTMELCAAILGSLAGRMENRRA